MPSKALKYEPFKRKTISKISLILIIFSIGQGQSLFIDQAHAVKVGQSCAKVGLKNGSFVCTKVKGKLIWQLVKKKQSISATYPTKINVAALTTTIDFSATSNLAVKVNLLSVETCTLNENILRLIAIGYCSIQLTQSGNAQFLPAPPIEIKILIYGNNEISFSPPTSLPLDSSTYLLSGVSTSGLPVTFEALTPEICTISETSLSLIKVGYCKVLAMQGGSEFFDSAQNVEASISIQGSNLITFTPLSSQLLSAKTYLLSGISTSGLVLKYSSLTLDICSVTGSTLALNKVGSCRVVASQGGSDLYLAALSVEANINISGARVMSDQPDTVAGFQVKAIYVVPNDGVDHSYDTNGYIAGILDEGNLYLMNQVGLRVPIDKNTVGYDIQFMRTKFSTSYLLSASKLNNDLLVESLLLETPGLNRKDFIFFIDVNYVWSNQFCGYASRPGISAVVAVGPDCTGESLNFKDWASATWLHELIHNFGVSHTADEPCDFMRGYPETLATCPSGYSLTLDKNRNRYIGSSIQGQDILKLPVWEGYTNKDYWSKCSLNPVPRSDGFNYAYCPTGTQTIGALKNCWSSFATITLEEFIDGSWRSLGSGSHYTEPWGPNVDWQCNAGFSAPWKDLTVTNPGISLYRWMRNGVESEQFKVIWVR